MNLSKGLVNLLNSATELLESLTVFVRNDLTQHLYSSSSQLSQLDENHSLRKELKIHISCNDKFIRDKITEMKRNIHSKLDNIKEEIFQIENVEKDYKYYKERL